MKCKQSHFDKIVETFRVLNKYFDNLLDINYFQLDSLLISSYSAGHSHNSFVIVGDQIHRRYWADDMNLEYTPLFELDDEFIKYHQTLNDSHRKTAITKACKILKNEGKV